ncbi:hypothetical protein MN116_008015 [Schistosoma mekongi]|uniref:Alpha-galactosidase n=1 Tax=Schistosoma mekongi TaxID=38744 RepID=A0AAE2D3E8_SCHME|nr:hypothetical protein MN116_008015 [Schistosoma mekongi]
MNLLLIMKNSLKVFKVLYNMYIPRIFSLVFILNYGTKTCSNYPGSMNYLEVDAKSVAKWKVDYVKMDKCNSPVSIQPEGFENFSRLLNATGRRIVFSCGYPANVSWLKNPNLNDWSKLPESCNTWRLLGDVQESWTSVFSIINAYISGNNVIPKLAGPGHWNDPDVLLMSSFGLPDVQKRVQFGLWCMFAAPLLIATDMDKLDDFSVSLLRNKQLLAIDQDKGGHQAEFVKTRNYVQMWIRLLDDDPVGWAIAYFYTIAGGKPIYFHTSLNEFNSQLYSISGDYFELIDVFTGVTFKKIELNEKFMITINLSSIMMYRVKPIHHYQPLTSSIPESIECSQNACCKVGLIITNLLDDFLLCFSIFYILKYL